MYTPARAGPIAIPMNNNSAPIPTDIPVNSFGEEDTIIFQVVVIVSDRPMAIMAKSTETMNSVAWNISNPNVPSRLMIPPIIIGFILPILFMINGVILANTKKLIMKGS